LFSRDTSVNIGDVSNAYTGLLAGFRFFLWTWFPHGVGVNIGVGVGIIKSEPNYTRPLNDPAESIPLY
jgi:hypothetical protein